MTEIVPIKLGRKPALTPRQMKFAELYVLKRGELSGSQCAFEAGYKTRPNRAASELKNPRIYPLVANYIKELEAEVREKYGIDYHKHLAELGKIRNKAFKDKSTLSTAATTEIARGKVAGLYVDRRETTNLNVELDKMSYEDLIEKMSEFVNQKTSKNVTPVTESVESTATKAPDTDSKKK